MSSLIRDRDRDPDFTTVTIHRSQFPEQLEMELRRGLEEGRIDPKFHYLSHLQMRRWLALSRAYAPIACDQDCRAAYDQCFSHLASQFRRKSVHVVGLGCGAGQKDVRLLIALRRKSGPLRYTACDSSLPMVLTARQVAGDSGSVESMDGLVCDIGSSPDLEAFFAGQEFAGDFRLYLCFGVIPNFEPGRLFDSIQRCMKPEDYLLLGANLVPKANIEAELENILTQYDNPLTRDWLLTLFQELGVDLSLVKLSFGIENSEKYENLRRIAATVHLEPTIHFRVGDAAVVTSPHRSIQLFFSYRYTESQIHAVLKAGGLEVISSWITASSQEGLFLCRRHPLQEI